MRKILFTLMTAFLSFIGLSAQVDFKEVVLNGDEPAVVDVEMGVNYFILTAPQTGTLGFRGASRLVEGMRAEDAIAKLAGIRCGFKATSCPDQLSKALRIALAEEAKRQGA